MTPDPTQLLGETFPTLEEAEEWLDEMARQGAQLEQETRPSTPADLKALRKAMADAHPDRGGTNEQFIAAREAYERALRESVMSTGDQLFLDDAAAPGVAPLTLGESHPRRSPRRLPTAAL